MSQLFHSQIAFIDFEIGVISDGWKGLVFQNVMISMKAEVICLNV